MTDPSRPTEPPSAPRRPGGGLVALLDELADRVPEVRCALVLSHDGLPTGASEGCSPADAAHLSALASGFHSLAAAAGRHFQAGGARRTVVQLDGGILFVLAAGRGSALAVLTGSGTDMGLVSHEMARLIRRAGEHLPAPPGNRP